MLCLHRVDYSFDVSFTLGELLVSLAAGASAEETETSSSNVVVVTTFWSPFVHEQLVDSEIIGNTTNLVAAFCSCGCSSGFGCWMLAERRFRKDFIWIVCS